MLREPGFREQARNLYMASAVTGTIPYSKNFKPSFTTMIVILSFMSTHEQNTWQHTCRCWALGDNMQAGAESPINCDDFLIPLHRELHMYDYDNK